MITTPRLFVAALACLVLAFALPANAVQVASMTDHLLGYGTVNDLKLDAVVDYNAGIFTYSYTLQYLTGSNSVLLLSVENPDDVPYTSASNSGTFQNPSYDPMAYAFEVLWRNGTLQPGQTRQFSYQSIYGWREIPVSAYASSGGDSADGTTLGMTASVPEPSSLAGLAMAGFGIVPVLRRRRK